MVALAEKEKQLQDITTRYQQTQGYAALSIGTGQEQEAVSHLKMVEKELKKAQEALDQGQEWDSRDRAKEEAVMTAARDTIAKRQRELSDLQAKHMAICAAREQAHQECGQQLKAAALSAIAQQQTRIEALRSELVQEQVRIEQLYDEQTEQLADYPDLQREIMAMQTQSDATSRVITAAIAYISTLLAERRDIETTLSLPAARYQSPWWTMLCIPDSEVWLHQNIRSNASNLEMRKEKLEQLLAEYRESQKANSV